MKRPVRNIILLLTIGLLDACSISQATPNLVTPTVTVSVPQSQNIFSEAETKTLASLKQVDDYPLYVMQYYGEYTSHPNSSRSTAREAGPTSGWACSLFTVLLDDNHLLYGRNFDWDFSPAVLVFTYPPDGYASVSMVDIAYLGYSNQAASKLIDLPIEKRGELLSALQIPFDGMNEYGLAIGMAAVPSADMPPTDPSKERIGALQMIREILDHARDVNEAVDLIKEYNIDFTGGPPVHYLIADAKAKAALVSFYQGEIHIFENEQPWHSATNFLRSSVEDPKGNCWRYDKINARLNEKQGMLDSSSAMELLSEVAQDGRWPTQWSVVYQMARGEVSIVMGKDYANVHTFRMSDYLGPK